VSCDSQNYGCEGGLQWWASEFLKDEGTILATDYPYENANRESTISCNSTKRNKPKVFYLQGNKGYKTIASNKTAFKNALLIEPTNVSFAVGNDFMYYSSGIYTGAGCAYQLNHAMQAVGFGVENGVEYTWNRN